jgi:hypothetical protein
MSAKYIHNVFTDRKGKITVKDVKVMVESMLNSNMLEDGAEQNINLYTLPYNDMMDEVILMPLKEFLDSNEYDEVDEFKFLISCDQPDIAQNVFPLENFEEGAKELLQYTLYIASSKYFLAPDPLGAEGQLLSASGDEVNLNYEKAILENDEVMFYDAGFYPFKEEEFEGAVVLQNMDGATGELKKKEFLPSKNGMKFELSKSTPKGSAASLSDGFKSLVKQTGLGDDLIEIPIWF